MSYKLVILDMEGTVTHEDTALPWAEALLASLSAKGIKKALVSDLPTDKVKEKLSGAGIPHESFDEIISSQHYSEAFADTAKKYGAANDECVVCTASIVAVKLASRLGMKCAAVRTHFKEEMYKKTGADIVCSDLSVLTDFLA